MASRSTGYGRLRLGGPFSGAVRLYAPMRPLWSPPFVIVATDDMPMALSPA
jgi:hypothetical protein